MVKKDTRIQNSTGLHARPASVFINAAKKFTSKITIKNLDDPDAEAVNAKSIVMLLMLGLSCGTNVQICAEGEDEALAADSLVNLIENELKEEA